MKEFEKYLNSLKFLQIFSILSQIFLKFFTFQILPDPFKFFHNALKFSRSFRFFQILLDFSRFFEIPSDSSRESERILKNLEKSGRVCRNLKGIVSIWNNLSNTRKFLRILTISDGIFERIWKVRRNLKNSKRSVVKKLKNLKKS